MTVGYTKDQFDEIFTELEKLDKHSDEYFYKYMKFIISFGRATIITERGIQKGKELYEKWKKGEELTREENITCGFLLSDICVLENNSEMTEAVVELYDEMITKHKPDFGYLQSFCQDYVVRAGYAEPNPKYMEAVEQMFTTEHVLPDPKQLKMITTGEMPTFNKIMICPYCGEPFEGDGVEDLFKHVESEHDKK